MSCLKKRLCAYLLPIGNSSVVETDISFGSRIVSIRRKQKLAQGDLATKVGLHANVLGRYERGEATPSVEIAAKIAKALVISLDYLIELSDVEVDPIILKRIQDITSLSDEDREHIFKVVDALIRDAKAKK